jgi:hypothetical protein
MWRLLHSGMASGMRTVAVLAVALIAVSFAAESSPARTGFTTQAFPPGKKFVSKRYGYEFVLPVGRGRWYVTYASMAWNGKEFPFGDSGKVEVLGNLDDRKFIAAATQLSTGTTLRKWQASYIAVMQSFCKKARALRNTTLGGVAARQFTIRCPMYDVIAVVALHRGRGYFFQFLSPSSNTEASDRRIFDAGRRTFRFTSN